MVQRPICFIVGQTHAKRGCSFNESTSYLRMQKDCQQDSRSKYVKCTKFIGYMQISEFVMFVVVGRFERAVNSEYDTHNAKEAHNFNNMVKPVTRFVYLTKE